MHSLLAQGVLEFLERGQSERTPPEKTTPTA
jgi:hypothetical protein